MAKTPANTAVGGKHLKIFNNMLTTKFSTFCFIDSIWPFPPGMKQAKHSGNLPHPLAEKPVF